MQKCPLGPTLFKLNTIVKTDIIDVNKRQNKTHNPSNYHVYTGDFLKQITMHQITTSCIKTISFRPCAGSLNIWMMNVSFRQQFVSTVVPTGPHCRLFQAWDEAPEQGCSSQHPTTPDRYIVCPHLCMSNEHHYG